MEEKNACLADSSGSDGSLSKDLPKRAEMNFSTTSLPLEIDMDESCSKDEKNPTTQSKGCRETAPAERDDTELTPDYCNLDKLSDSEVDALMVCEKCHGPITKLKRYGNSSKQFCSRQCAQSEQGEKPSTDNEADKDSVLTSSKTFQAIESLIPQNTVKEPTQSNEVEKDGKFDWNAYQKELNEKSAPTLCFSKLSKAVKGLKPGMKLEAIDKNNPCNYCVATVIEVVGHRVRIRYDGFGDDSSQDFWCNFQAEELFQIGWCAENSFPLQPPSGIISTLEDWKIFLTKTLTGALASPLDLFRENENRIQTKVHSFTAGMKVEVIHPKRPSIISPATITKSLGPFHYQVTTENLPNLPAYTFYGKSESTGIFSFGWSARHGIDLALPAFVDGTNLTKDKYFAMCRMKSAPTTISEGKRVKNIFKTGHKLEAVDLEEPFMIRVATVFNVIGRILLLLFDGHSKFQYVDYESEDIYPIGWCLRTGHPLSTPHGIIYPSKSEHQTEAEITVDDSGIRSVTMPSFHTVLGKQGPQVKEELNKKLKAKADTAGTAATTQEAPVQSNPNDIQEVAQDDAVNLGSYCVHFSKTCIIGPYLDPEKVAKMSGKTASAKPPAAVKFALEKIIELAKDPIDTMDAIQNGFSAKLFSKGKSKVLKKGLFRFDTKVRASKLLKRLCKRLKSCDYFLSFDPPKDPCPFDCQTSGTTTAENFIAIKSSHVSNEDQSYLLDFRKRRGRPRKESDAHLEAKVSFAKSEGEAISVNQSNVQVVNIPSFNGRPLIPIAPVSKTPVTIMSSGQLPNTRMPPPYDMGGHSSFIHHGNTVITSATQPRMVTPMNVRMIPSTAKPTVVSGGDLSSPTFTTPNLATVLVVTKPQPGQGLYSIRGNLNSQSIRLPMSPSSRKSHLQLVNRPKLPRAIRIHGPMVDQAPGTMNPTGSGSESKQSRNENGLKLTKLGPQLHIPTQKLGHTQLFDSEADMMSDSSLFRSLADKMSPSHVPRFVTMKPPLDIKLEPQEQFFQGSDVSQDQVLSPSPHIQLLSPSYHHLTPISGLQDKSNSIEVMRSDTTRPDNIRPDGIRQDGIALLSSDHDSDKSTRNHSSNTSPSASEFTSHKYELGPHQKRRMVPLQQQTHIPSNLQNHFKNHLKVATSSNSDSQSALSPLHSPPPLRPAPASQHRSIALRSPPNLTPSTVISHFNFSSPVITTTSVISQAGRIIHHPGPLPISSKCFLEDDHNMGNGQIRSHDTSAVTCVGNSIENNSPSHPSLSHTKTATLNFTCIPIKDQATDKIVYVPINGDAEKERPPKMLFYSAQHSQPHHFREQMPVSAPPLTGQTDPKLVSRPLDGTRQQSFPGRTRKFTVRSLHRDSNSAPFSSGPTTVRIQGPPLKREEAMAQNPQEEVLYPSKDRLPDGISRNLPNIGVPPSEIIPYQKKLGDDLSNQRNGRPSIQAERIDGNSSFFENSDILYEEISDDDEDDDDDEMDYECSDDNMESEGLNGDVSAVDQQKGQSFRGPHRNKKLSLSRRKSTSNHNHKLKYKQALEQAKFMREQRPTFFTPQIQVRHTNEYYSNPREVAPAFQLDRGSRVKPADTNEAREDKEKDKLVESATNAEQLGKTSDNANAIQPVVVNNGLLVAKEPKTSSSNSPQNENNEKGGTELKNLKRKKTDSTTKFDNGFLFGKWSLDEDTQIKRKKLIDGAHSNSTRYLSDPLEKVKLPQNPELWSEEDVSNFINATDCSEYADTLKDQEIDGSALLLLTRESLMEFAGMKLGPALKICGYIATLKGRLRMEQNMALIQG